MFGILNVNKRAGWTSRDVVNRVHRFVRPEKAGHAGTLDPLATGVLVVAVGQATRLIQYAHRLPKSYRAKFLLGRRSASDDVDTELEMLDAAPIPSPEQIEAALPRFLGEIQQRPPAFSAVSVQGQRAYKLARRGDEVTLPPRPITIHSLNLAFYEYPELVLDIRCGSGTYVRALGRDLAESLQTAAVLAALERTEIGSLEVSAGVDVDQIENRIQELLLPPRLLIEALPWISLTQDEIQELHFGRTVNPTGRQVHPPTWPGESDSAEIAGLDEDGRVLSILQATETGAFRPLSNLPRSD
jgi:tRNA pseudouridine55 synthase